MTCWSSGLRRRSRSTVEMTAHNQPLARLDPAHVDPLRIDPARLRAAMRPSYIALTGFVLLYLSWQMFHWGPLDQELAGGILGTPLEVVAAYAAWRASRRAPPYLRNAWRWIAVALACQAAGSVAQLVYENVLHELAYPSLADLMYLSFYPLLLVGILHFPSAREHRGQTLELVLDCAIVALGGAAVFVYFTISPETVASGGLLTTATSVAYPIGDLIVLVALWTSLTRGTRADTRRALTAMSLAMALFIVADLIYGYIVLHGTFHSGDPIETMYMLAFACFIVAATTQSSDETVERSRPAGSSARWLPYAGITAILAIALAVQYKRPLFPDLSVMIIVVLSGTLVVLRQITYQHTLRRSSHGLAHAQELAQLGSWEWDLRHDTIERSEEDLRLYGLEANAPPMTHEEAFAVIHPDDRERVEQIIGTALKDAKPFTYEMRIVRHDGEERTLLTRGDVQKHSGRVTQVRGTHQDITDRRRMEAQLHFQANHDPLTGLYNRHHFGNELERVLRYASRFHRPGALMLLDFDDFKFVNDAHGHAAGDEMLKAFGNTISNRVRKSDVVARLGADEFAILLPDIDEPDARVIAEDIRLDAAAHKTGSPIHLSGGIVPFDGSQDMVAADALIAVDIALTEAKENGKDQVRVYRGSTGATVTWVERIRAALAEGRLVLYGQPMLDLETREVAYNELLIRMLSDDGELIAPDAFLPTAERFGLIVDIDCWVTREGMRLAQLGERVSINLSAHSIGEKRILDIAREMIDQGVDPSSVIFEITETAAMTNMDEARVFTEALTKLGCDVALDDFGTGFGSFTYLKHLPARYLKIDMEFVRDVVCNQTDRQVVNSINQVAHSLGKRTIAEGVEDEATLQTLRELDVDYAQGFFIGEPQRISPPTRFERLRTKSPEGGVLHEDWDAPLALLTATPRHRLRRS